MISFNWPIIIFTTIVLYVLTIITLPFNTVNATIFLFSLIAFWSRLPGCCIYEPIRLMYMMDFVDVFAVFISIYVGPIQGALFALFWNIYPRLAGNYLPWIAFFKDGGVQAFICLFVPTLFAMTGNLITVVVIYSVARIILYTIVSFFLPNRSLIEHIIQSAIAGFNGIVINIFYTKFFGDFFTNLLKKGSSFSWTLFFIATAVILLFSMLVFGFSPKETGKKIGKNVSEIVKHQIKKKVQKTDKKTAEDMDFMNDISRSIQSGRK